MSDIKVNNIQSLSGTNGPVISGTVDMNSTGAMSLPRGDTAYRGGRGRGLFGGGAAPTSTNTINYITIASIGDAQDFGDLTDGRDTLGSCASSTRSLWAGAWGSVATPTTRSNTIDYVTISSTGNAFDFGDLTRTRELVATSNLTRGVFAGGADTTPGVVTLNTIDYVTISSLGNASSFGDLFTGRYGLMSCSNEVRGIFSGGASNSTGSSVITNVIQYITISTTGDAQDFGDLTVARRYGAGCSNSVRGLFCAGDTPAQVDTIDYITIASTGDAIDFGDSTDARLALGSCSNKTRGLFAGGASPAKVDLIEFVTILTLGNAQDFGDLKSLTSNLAGCSDSHGGIG